MKRILTLLVGLVFCLIGMQVARAINPVKIDAKMRDYVSQCGSEGSEASFDCVAGKAIKAGDITSEVVGKCQEEIPLSVKNRNAKVFKCAFHYQYADEESADVWLRGTGLICKEQAETKGHRFEKQKSACEVNAIKKSGKLTDAHISACEYPEIGAVHNCLVIALKNPDKKNSKKSCTDEINPQWSKEKSDKFLNECISTIRNPKVLAESYRSPDEQRYDSRYPPEKVIEKNRYDCEKRRALKMYPLHRCDCIVQRVQEEFQAGKLPPQDIQNQKFSRSACVDRALTAESYANERKNSSDDVKACFMRLIQNELDPDFFEDREKFRIEVRKRCPDKG